MSKQFRCVGVLLPVMLIPAFAQSGPTVVGATYSSRTMAVAPGQIVRLQVAGLKTILPCDGYPCRVVQATAAPLPTTLAGISVTINEYTEQFLAYPYTFVGSVRASLVSIQQLFSCSTVATALTANPNPANTTPGCYVTFLTIQIPYELSFNPIGNPYVAHEVVISENGTDSQPFVIGVTGDQIHVVTSCDSTLGQAQCPSIVAHLDGTRVSSQAPAKPGETVVIYAWGLGKTTRAVRTGDVTQSPAPALSQYPGGPYISFDFSPNAAPSYFLPNTPFVVAPAYLTPGQIGLYQVAVQLPSSFPAVVSCDSTFVTSNLTINLRGVFSFDGAAICIGNSP